MSGEDTVGRPVMPEGIIDRLLACADAVASDFAATHGRALTHEEHTLVYLTLSICRGMLEAEMDNLRDEFMAARAPVRPLEQCDVWKAGPHDMHRCQRPRGHEGAHAYTGLPSEEPEDP